MVSADTKPVIARAKQIYTEQLQAVLEPQHLNRFVAIEPESGEYFLGDTFDEAVKLARAKHPSRLSHTIRIGHRACLSHGGHAAVTGFVDDQLRALLRVPVSASRDGQRTDLLVWIDTAFNGGLAIPRQQVAELGLSKQSSAEAILADGRSVE